MYLITPSWISTVPMDVEYHIVTFGDPEKDAFTVTTVIKDGKTHDSYMTMRTNTPTGHTYFDLKFEA